MKCWVCDSNSMSFYREGQSSISEDDLLITDSRYGMTLPLFKCLQCGFLQCDTEKLDDLYERLEDKVYIESSEQREKQFNYLLNKTLPHENNGICPNAYNILDVGAGTGLFVKLAMERGFEVSGIEPSSYLANYAISQGLPVTNSAIPDYAADSFDAIYMTDVLEHVANPLPLLLEYTKTLKNGGVLFVTVPNVSSAIARLMRKNWWHYRLAHVGYYNKKTLNHLFERAGFALNRYHPVRWYFKAEYAFERAAKYLPFLREKDCPKVLTDLFIPISFGDSILAAYKKQ